MKLLMSLLGNFQSVSTEALFDWVTAGTFVLLGFLIAVLLYVILPGDKGYKQGQIDALNGKVKYKKEKNQDGETVWMEIKRKEQTK